jgi:glycine reductase
MTPDSPGVLASEGAAYILPTTANVAGMRDAVPAIASIASRLAAGTPVGSADDEGYLPRGLRVNVRSAELGAERAVGLLLAKIVGDIRTEIAPPTDRVAPPDPLADPAHALVALVTEAGCVPQGNPDHLPTRHANVWLRYPIGDRAELGPEDYLSVHAGFDTTEANRDPDRLVPLDAARALVEAGSIGRVHDEFFTTTGVDTPVAVSTRMGQEIGAELRNAGVEAVILTGT